MLQVVFDTLLEALKTYIEKRENKNAENRDAIAYFLHHFSVLSQECKSISEADSTYSSIIYYERIRLNVHTISTRQGFEDANNVSFFWECLPRRLPLVSTFCFLSRSQAKSMTSVDFLVEQRKHIHIIDACSTMKEIDEMKSLGLKRPNTLLEHSSLIPFKVQAFMSITASMFYSLRNEKPSSEFSQCLNKKCRRQFYKNAKHRIRDCFDSNSVSGDILDVSLCNPILTTMEGGIPYWKCCKNLPFYTDSIGRFCSSGCCIEWRRQLDNTMPLNENFNFEPDLILPVGKTSRIQNSLEKAVQRNRLFEKEIQKNSKNSKRIKVVSKRTIKNELESRIEMLNVDTALLYWSTLVSALPFYSHDSTLPGLQADWRSMQVNVNRCQYISRLYSQLHDDDDDDDDDGRRSKTFPIITSTVLRNKLYSLIKSQCMSVDQRLSVD